MSVVIIGGNERMACQYEGICKQHGCTAKIFIKNNGPLKKKIGIPDLIILLTNTVSHNMIYSAISEARRNNIPVVRTHSSSATALNNLLKEHCNGGHLCLNNF